MLKPIVTIILLGTASAAPAQPLPRERIAIADLNLTSPAGIATLDARIRRAVRRLCPDSVELARRMAARSCRAKAIKQVARQRDTLIARAQAERAGRVAWVQ